MAFLSKDETNRLLPDRARGRRSGASTKRNPSRTWQAHPAMDARPTLFFQITPGTVFADAPGNGRETFSTRRDVHALARDLPLG
jgi:hypothetical protein